MNIIPSRGVAHSWREPPLVNRLRSVRGDPQTRAYDYLIYFQSVPREFRFAEIID